MVTDTIADLLSRIRNAQSVRHSSVRVPSTKVIRALLEVLKGEGFIEGFKAKTVEGEHEMIEVKLKYFADGAPLIGAARRISSPGRRVYSAADQLPRVHAGLGMVIISTSQGVMSDRVAREKGIGGEVIASIGA